MVSLQPGDDTYKSFRKHIVKFNKSVKSVYFKDETETDVMICKSYL